MTEPTTGGGFLRVRCDEEGCGKTYTPRGGRYLDPRELRKAIPRGGWTSAGGRDLCPDHGGGRAETKTQRLNRVAGPSWHRWSSMKGAR